MTLKLYDIIFDHDTHDPYYRSPNPWKIRLALLQKGLPFETIEVTHIDISTTLTARYGKRATCPALELEDGTLLCNTVIPLPQPKSHSEKHSQDSSISDSVTLIRNGRSGLNSSSPISSPPHPCSHQTTPTSPPTRNGGQEGTKAMTDKALERDALIERAKLNILPIAAVLRERPGEFLQGREPGYTDFVVFGRYAMCRNCNPGLAKQVWEDSAVEIMEWVERMVERFPEIRGHLRPYDL
ncbi:hypothetical protein BC829DRAFT_410786 [Chytridium lagenaria]|nr:hypothetical protein BC829DRAFT_410786 [Chytridium lagenaria]